MTYSPLSKPTIEDVSNQIQNDLFQSLIDTMIKLYKVQVCIEYSKCSWERGWNVKLKKGGKTLCTIYPRERFFTVLIVIGRKEKECMEKLLSSFHPRIQSIYRESEEGNEQRWLMIDIEDEDGVYQDIIRLCQLRFDCK